MRVTPPQDTPAGGGAGITLCLAGDVMTGRGVDQVLSSPGDPQLWEQSMTDARAYVGLAERANGPVPRPVPDAWPWGDALELLDELAPDVRIVNLETSITARGEPALRKSVQYRMHPGNIGCLTVARLDVCTLANNHVLDFGRTGLLDTLDTLAAAGLAAPGAGRTLDEARRPAVARVEAGTPVAVVSCADTSSGTPADWAATEDQAGVHLLPDLRDSTADALVGRAREHLADDALVVVSIHWGANWGYKVPRDHVRFAHRLIDAGAHVVQGHSSHHPLPIEVYRGRLILYGCGDLIDDYEGIGGYERYRDDLRLLHLPAFDPSTGQLTELRLAPLQAHRLRLRRAGRQDTEWLRDLLARLSRREVLITPAGLLTVAP